MDLSTFHCCLYDAQTGDGRLLEEIQRKKKTKGGHFDNYAGYQKFLSQEFTEKARWS